MIDAYLLEKVTDRIQFILNRSTASRQANRGCPFKLKFSVRCPFAASESLQIIHTEHVEQLEIITIIAHD